MGAQVMQPLVNVPEPGRCEILPILAIVGIKGIQRGRGFISRPIAIWSPAQYLDGGHCPHELKAQTINRVAQSRAIIAMADTDVVRRGVGSRGLWPGY